MTRGPLLTPSPPGDTRQVRACVLLLLELARGTSTSMQDELAGGSWSADLMGATLALVRNDVHPQLADLCLPAKMLQNAVARGQGGLGE